MNELFTNAFHADLTRLNLSSCCFIIRSFFVLIQLNSLQIRVEDNTETFNENQTSIMRINSFFLNHAMIFLLIRLFASKCAKCHESFSKNEFFIRTPCYRRYHPDCFSCDHCNRLLVSGDDYYLHGQNQIFCRDDFQQFYSTTDSIGDPSTAGIDFKRKKSVWRAYILTSVRMWLWREGRN